MTKDTLSLLSHSIVIQMLSLQVCNCVIHKILYHVTHDSEISVASEIVSTKTPPQSVVYFPAHWYYLPLH